MVARITGESYFQADAPIVKYKKDAGVIASGRVCKTPACSPECETASLEADEPEHHGTCAHDQEVIVGNPKTEGAVPPGRSDT